MPLRGLPRRLAVAVLVLPLVAACDAGKPQRNQSPSADPTQSSPSPTASSPTPSPTPTASWSEMTLKTAQKKYVSYYYDYVDATRQPAEGDPPKKLVAQTDPDGPERDWLKNAWADGRRTGGYVASGNVKVSSGPETYANGNRTRLKFRACIDPGNARIKVDGKLSKLSWQLMNVEMRSKKGASKEQVASDTSIWRVYSADTVSNKKCGF